MSYEAAKKRAEPYTKIVEELSEMRRDTLELVKKAVREKRQAYVLVNNRSEGNAPLTIQALQNALQAAGGGERFHFYLSSPASQNVAFTRFCTDVELPLD